MENLGTCPVCGIGQMIKGSHGFVCNHFKTQEDKCGFTIYSSYYGIEITEKIAMQLINDGTSDLFDNFVKQTDGTKFSAALCIKEGKVKLKFPSSYLENTCPACGGKVEILLNGYACVNYKPKDAEGNERCALYIPNKIASRDIPKEIIEILLQKKETPFMTGFKTKEGHEFSTRLILTKDLGISFNSNLCKCPACGGNLYSGKKSYNCSNYKNENIKCAFVIWKEIRGRTITVDEVIQLCEKKETSILSGFKIKDDENIEGKLIINEEFKVKLI